MYSDKMSMYSFVYLARESGDLILSLLFSNFTKFLVMKQKNKSNETN